MALQTGGPSVRFVPIMGPIGKLIAGVLATLSGSALILVLAGSDPRPNSRAPETTPRIAFRPPAPAEPGPVATNGAAVPGPLGTASRSGNGGPCIDVGILGSEPSALPAGLTSCEESILIASLASPAAFGPLLGTGSGSSGRAPGIPRPPADPRGPPSVLELGPILALAPGGGGGAGPTIVNLGGPGGKGGGGGCCGGGDPVVTPLPGAAWLMLGAIGGLAALRQRRQRQRQPS